jgi:uncharacterized protein
MLIEFKVTNYRSILETQTLSMVASSAREHSQTHTIDPRIAELGRLLRSTVIYGANAAGKSNVLRALEFMKNLIVNSAIAPPTAEVPYDPFKLSAASRNLPSEFEIAFIQEGTRYEYGFSVTSERIHREWLIEYPRGRGRKLFTREYDAKRNLYNWHFSQFFRGNRLVWRDATRQNALFLSTAIQLNSTQLLPVFAWFQRRLIIIVGNVGFNALLTLRLLETPEGKDRVLPFVQEADSGIIDVELQRETLPVTGGMFPGTGAMMMQDGVIIEASSLPGSQPNMVKISFSHSTVDTDQAVKLNISEESSGTRALFMTAGAWLNVFQNGEVLLFDEIDTSLHPLLTRFLVSQFHSEKSNPNAAQLIFSTHDTSLLSRDVFRRDQVWFVEKNEDRTTKLFPLTDFSPRNDEALERAYLRGRYGAIPILDEQPS